jgi:hypothetical protein
MFSFAFYPCRFGRDVSLDTKANKTGLFFIIAGTIRPEGINTKYQTDGKLFE